MFLVTPATLEPYRVRHPLGFFPGEMIGAFCVPGLSYRHPNLWCIVSNGADWPFEGIAWEHVSVSHAGEYTTGSMAGAKVHPSCPTWDEMQLVRKLFWPPEETVIQIHPPEAEHVNRHPFVLHLWRPVGIEIPRPPMGAV